VAYRAEIEIAVKGARELSQFQNKLKATALEVEQLNNFLKNFADQAAGIPRSLSNLNRQLQEASQAFNEVALGTKEAKTAASDYLAATRNLNAGLRERADLLAEVAENERKARLASRGIQERTQYKSPLGPFQATALGTEQALVGQTSPIDPKRLLDIKKDQLELDRALFNLAKKTAEPLNLQLQLQEGLVAGTREVLELAEQAKRVQGPALPPGFDFDKGAAKAAAAQVEALVQKRADASIKAAKEVDEITRSLDIKQNKAKIDQILQEFKTEERTQKSLFDNAIALDKKEGAAFDRELARRINKTEAAQKRLAERSRRRNEALGSAIIGGAFPLLFGQGAGAAIGGGLGGAGGGLLGGQFGFGLSLVGTALGTAVDQAVQKLKDLAAALGDPTATLEKLEEAGYKVDFSIKKQVETLLESGKAYEAQKVALDAVNASMGPDAVAQLATYEEANQELQSVYQDLTTELNKELLPALIQLTKIAARFAKAIKQERQISATPIPGFKELPGVGKPTVGGVSGVIQDVFSIFGPNTLPKVLFRGLSIAGKTGLTRDTPKVSQEILDQTKPKTVEAFTQELDLRNRINTAIKAGNDLTEKTAYEAARQVIFAEERLALQKAGNNENRRQLIEKDRINKLDRLKERRDKQVEALRKRGQGTSDREAKALERSRKTGEAIIRRLDQELAIKRARNILEEDILRIEFNREREQLKINGLKDKELKDAATIRNNEVAALATVEAQVQAKLRLANLNTKILNSTKAFGGDPSQGPAFSAGIGLDVMGREKEALDEFLKKYKQVGEAAQITGQLVTFGFRDMVAGVKSAEQVFADFLNSLADMLLKTAQEMIAQYIAIGIARMFAMGGSPASYVKDVDMNKSFFGGGGGPSFMEAVGFGGFLANGGPVTGGTPYVVGERGPELFVPSNSGTVVPNNALGGNVSIVVNVTEGQTDARGGDGQANQLGKSIAAAVQSELIKQKRPGGLLAR
jgi:hypothetical protein